MKSVFSLCLGVVLLRASPGCAQGVKEHMIEGAPPYWNAEPYRPERSTAVPNRPPPPAYLPRLRRIHPHHHRPHRR